MTDDESVLWKTSLLSNFISIAMPEIGKPNAAGHYGYRRRDATVPQNLDNALRGGKDEVAAVRIPSAQPLGKLTHPGEVTGYVVRVALIKRVMGEDQGNVPASRDPGCRRPKKKRMMRVDDIRPEGIDDARKDQAGGRTTEKLLPLKLVRARVRTTSVSLERSTVEQRCNHQHPMALASKLFGKRRHRTRHTPDVGCEGVRHHEQVHGLPLLSGATAAL